MQGCDLDQTVLTVLTDTSTPTTWSWRDLHKLVVTALLKEYIPLGLMIRWLGKEIRCFASIVISQPENSWSHDRILVRSERMSSSKRHAEILQTREFGS